MSESVAKGKWRARATEVDRSSYSQDVSAGLIAWRPLGGVVLSYLAMASEVDVRSVNELPRVRALVTRTPQDGPLTVHEYQPDRLERHPYGFLQPSADAPQVPLDNVDMALVPGLAFDLQGNRLGRGKGYYDRLLRALPKGVIRVGVIVDELLVDEVPTEPHDDRVAWVATESGVHRVGDPVPEATERFLADAIRAGIAPDIHRFPQGTRTSRDAAFAVGADLGAIAKSILFDVDGTGVLVIASGDTRINEEKLAAVVGGELVSIASRAMVRSVTGYVAGGTPSLGFAQDAKIVADCQLARYRWVWSAGGTPDTVYPVALDRLIAASGARWADVTDWGSE